MRVFARSLVRVGGGVAGKRWFSPSATILPPLASASVGSSIGSSTGNPAQDFLSEPAAAFVQEDINQEFLQSTVEELLQYQQQPQQQQQQQQQQQPVKDYTSFETYKLTSRPPHEAYTLDPDSYQNEEFFKLEQQRVFGKSWVAVGMVDQLRQAGDTITTELAGQPIFIVRDKSGNLNGFLNVCRHRGSKLIKKNGRYPVISCPYHRWGYALDGRLLATPMWDTVEGGMRYDKSTDSKVAGKVKKSKKGRTAHVDMSDQEAIAAVEAAEAKAMESDRMNNGGAVSANCEQLKSIMAAYDTAHIKAFDKKDFSLFNVRVEAWGPFVFATLAKEEEVPALQVCLGDVPSQLANYPLHELVSVRSKKYESKANWKLLAENFMEYYHLPAVHPALCLVSGVDNHHRRQGPGQYVGFVTDPLSRGGTPIDPEIIPSMPGLQGREHQTAVFHHLFPNAFYFLLPSHIFTVIIEPVGPNRSIEYAELLVHPSLLEDAKVKEETAILNEKIDAMMAFYDMTNLEDIVACEDVQEGVRSRAYQGGRVSFRFEETIHRFQNMIIDHMVGYHGRVPAGDEQIPFYLGGQPPEHANPQLMQSSDLMNQ